MTSSSTIQAAVADAFATATVEAYSDIVCYYDVTEDSEIEISRFYKNNKINFYKCLITRAEEKETAGLLLQSFFVDIAYYLSWDTTGTSWQSARDGLEAVLDAFQSELGETISENVDYWIHQEGAPDITQVTIGGEKAWCAKYRITAFKQISIS